MIDLGPHANFIATAYGLVTLVTCGLILFTFLANRNVRAKLSRLEQEGFTRAQRPDSAPINTANIKSTKTSKSAPK